VWNGRVYVTTAISSKPGATFKRGLYGDGDASDDKSVHQWKLIALDLKSGKILWDRTAFEGEPK
jgi:outer membrane protein assembly factor BamB